MSVDRPSRGVLVFVCDACGDDIEITENVHVFSECWAVASAEGWKIKRGEHLCPDCAELD
jgi:predicted RNA-binding Zn-ribbon protein involved in translation (DUF1610 family)